MKPLLLLAFVLLPLAPALAQAPTVCCMAPASGPDLGGTLVTIRGTSLSSAMSVTVGGVILENLIAVDPFTLTGNVPAGTPGPADVVVTTPGGSATLRGGFTYQSCAPAAGFALGFSGRDRVVFGNGSSVYQNTLEAWVKPTGGSCTPVILEVGTGPQNPCGEGHLLNGCSYQLDYGVDPVGCGTSNFLTQPGSYQGIWTHLAGTFDGTVAKLYVNGKLAVTRTITQPPNVPPASSYIVLGDYDFCCGVHAFYVGEIDEVRIWSFPRTAQQIRDGMHRQLYGNEPGLVGYWRLDEGGGTQARPTGPGPTGTLGSGAGAPAWVASGAPLCATVATGGPGIVKDLLGGCGAGGKASATGTPDIGSKAFSFDLAGADSNASQALLLVGVGPWTILCSPCVVTSPVVAIGRPVTVGRATMPAPVPCDPSMVGGQIETQWLILGTAASPCAWAPGISASNRLLVTVGQ